MHDRGRAWRDVGTGGGACVAGETAIAADGMHPIGMNSCFNVLELLHILYYQGSTPIDKRLSRIPNIRTYFD